MIEAIVFPCTYRCDGRCIMCSIYERQTKDLPVEFFRSFFADPLVAGVKSINITGGEPTLRRDLGNLVKMISSECKQLREIIVNTNGLHPQRVKDRLTEVYQAMTPGTKLWVYVSVDSLNEKADLIRGVSHAAKKAMQSISHLKEMKQSMPGMEVGASCTITLENYNDINDVLEYARSEEIYVDLIYATVNTAYINSQPFADKFSLQAEQKQEVISLLENISRHQKLSSPEHYTKKLIERLKGRRGTKECIFRDQKGLLMEADGNVRVCGMTSDNLLGRWNSNESLKRLLDNRKTEWMECCLTCETDSYYGWTKEAQQEMQLQMLDIVKKRRQAELRYE